MQSSILSFPNRGRWGDYRYAGNCSGHIIKELLEHYKPKYFLDPAEGSGTSRAVAQEFGIRYVGLDLRTGFDLLDDSLMMRLEGQVDLAFFHPPYHNIVQYSGRVWGTPHKNDLSRCRNYEEYLNKLHIACKKISTATKPGGRIAILIGDIRKNGQYYSPQAEIQKFPLGNLESIIIKAQHNCRSNNKQYRGNLIRIMHEYLLIFKKLPA